MAQYKVTKWLDGPRHAIFHVYLIASGLGDLEDETLIDPATLVPECTRVAVEQVMFNLAGFDASLKFDSGLVTDEYVWVLPEGDGGKPIDFTPFGGFSDRSGLDGTGLLQINTNGFTEVGDQGSIILKVKKLYR